MAVTDTLSEILKAVRLRAEVFFSATQCGNWELDTSGDRIATFHLVTRGSCWLRLPDQPEPIPLTGGDLVVFPHDAPHAIAGCRSADPDAAEIGGAVDTSLACGYFRFGRARGNPILDSLPEIVHLRASETRGWLDTLIRLIATELENNDPGASALIDRLSDALFIQVVRACIDIPSRRAGILAVLADARLSTAIDAFHQEPNANWTLEKLARAAGMSRTAFAERFHRVAEITPMLYVTHWRMHQARDSLQHTNQSIAQIAEQSGYQSEAAFNKAFKRTMGITPGALRRGYRE